MNSVYLTGNRLGLWIRFYREGNYSIHTVCIYTRKGQNINMITWQKKYELKNYDHRQYKI